MIEVEQLRTRLYQDILEVRQYITQNSWGQHSYLKPGEYKLIKNFELYDGFIKDRRGSDFLRPTTTPEKAGVGKIKQSIVWDVGIEQYLIYNQDNRLYYQQVIPTPGNPVLIADFVSNPYFLGTTANPYQPDFVLQGGRLFIFHFEGNAVIEFESGSFFVRDMGMVGPKIDAVTTVGTGNIGGAYTYGIEKVYQKNGGDFLASSPQRYTIERVLANISIAFTDLATVQITIDSTELENDDFWTHVRLWRSLSQTTDATDTLNPIDPQGVPEELYEVALITRAEMTNLSIVPIATSTDNLLPSGNVNTQAGQTGGPGTLFVIYDNSDDDFLSFAIGLDFLDLQPFPPANLGATQSNKIFIAGLGTNILSDGEIIDESRLGNVFYSDRADLQYGEQFSSEKFLSVELDGQDVTKLISFEKELIIIKESKTLRVLLGDVTLPVEVLDQRIGSPNKDFLEFVPTLGICGRVNDYGDFRILGYDFVWRSTFNGIDISKPIRKEMNGLVAGETSIIYINGKLLVANLIGTAYVLNVEQGLGWSEFQYLTGDSHQFFTFDNGARAGIAGAEKYLMEIEKENLETDVNYTVDPEFAGVPIDCEFITHQFQSGDGADVLEHEWLSIMAKVDKTIIAIPYVNSATWPDPNVESSTNFVLDPIFFSAIEALNDREHRLFIAPAAQGIFLFNRMIGNFLHYHIKTIAPCIFKSQKLHVIVDEDGIAWGEFDPFQILPTDVITGDIIETGTADDTYTETGIADDEIKEVS